MLWDQLDEFAAVFDQCIHKSNGQFPEALWHYTSAEGVKGILETRVLWLTAQPSAADEQEIHWGNNLVREAARSALRGTGCPALQVLLEDPSATLFRREREAFVACFTEDQAQWHRERRHPDGAALVFDPQVASGLLRTQEIGGSGMVRVRYDADAIRQMAFGYFFGIDRLVKVFPIDGSPPPNKDEEFWKAVAQWTMEPGVLSFFTKRPCWDWEREWRLIKRTPLLNENQKLDNPRRLECPLPPATCGLRSVVLGPEAAPALEGEIRALLQAGWSTDITVVRA